jgi:hypothetical protein
MEKVKSIKKNVMENMKGVNVQYLNDHEIKMIIGGITIGVESTLKSLIGNYDQNLIKEMIKELERKFVKDDLAYLLEKELEM